MAATLAAIFPVFALILIGWGAGRAGLLPADALAPLNGFVVRLALPVLLFHFVAAADWAQLWHPGVVAALAAGILAPFALVILSTRGDMTGRSIDALAAAYANTAFMGIPIGRALYGEIGVATAVIASLLTVCAVFALAVLLVEVDRHRDRGLTGAARGVAGSVLRNPLVLGPLAGGAWALTGLTLPAPLARTAELLGAAASPVALVTIGLFLAATPAGAAPRAGRIAPLLAIKLLLQPLVTWAAARLLGLPAGWTAAVVVVAALPTGTGPFMLAALYGREAGAVARVILVGTILSALTVPLVAAALR